MTCCLLSRVKRGNERRLRCTYRPLNVAKKCSLKFEKCWNEVLMFFFGTKQSKSMKTFWTKIRTGKLNNAGSVFRKQTRLIPSSMMKRHEFMKLKFQGKYRKVYMHQIEQGKIICHLIVPSARLSWFWKRYIVSKKWSSARSYLYGRKNLTVIWRFARLAFSCSLISNNETSTFVFECLRSK